MNKSVIIIGASGHGKVIADIVLKSGDKVAGFLDDDTTLPKEIAGFPLIGVVSDFTKYKDCSFIIGIGNGSIRKRIAELLEGQVSFYTAIHPAAVISSVDVNIGEGSAIMAGAVINAGTVIGEHSIINTSAVVEHDNKIGSFTHVSVGAKLGGTVTVGDLSWIGIGATVSNNISIADEVMTGAGAVIVKDISESGTYVGVPVRKIK